MVEFLCVIVKDYNINLLSMFYVSMFFFRQMAVDDCKTLLIFSILSIFKNRVFKIISGHAEIETLLLDGQNLFFLPTEVLFSFCINSIILVDSPDFARTG